jgi:type I restriction enzyme M protein
MYPNNREAGKNQNKLRTEDIEHIVSIYRNFTDSKLQNGIVEEKYAYITTPSEITENDYNLNIPRYVDTKELVEVQGKMKEYLKELGYE